MDRPRTITKNKIIEIIIITLVVISLTYVSVIAEPTHKQNDLEEVTEIETSDFIQYNK